ncbi:MAG: flavodoxin family protein [Firmicutes bacterium]|nr:flavodoxin family protein [Bacillota bacterium]MDY5676383.1 flavodoxin family protein [Eubacteriales bacterium]
MKKILFISGSARNGNCKMILEKIQKDFWLEYSTDLVHIRDYNIKECKGCNTCTKNKTHACVITDDTTKVLLEKVVDADIVVLATPNYFYNVSGLTKTFIDRTYSLYNQESLSGKKFVYIYVGEDDINNTKKYCDNAMYGFTICHKISVLDSFAFSAGDIGELKDPAQAQITMQEIEKVLRENLTEESYE